MKVNCPGQYNLLFSLSWAVMYLVHPSWALPITLTARGLLFFGLIVYFFALAYIMDRWFNAISIDEPVMVFPEDFSKHIKEHMWLLIICFIAVLLHIIPILSPIYIIGDEALFLQGGLWVYDYFGVFWHKVVKYGFWIVVVLTIIIAKMKSAGDSDGEVLDHKKSRVATSIFLLSGVCILVIYFVLASDLPFTRSIVRYPPLQKFLYLISYFVLGTNYIGPRLWQLAFYILSAIYLYRTINLVSGKDTALLGASIFLFSPIIFAHAHFAELASGLIFFIIIISYYFLRFLIYQDNRGLLLSSYFIGMGFLYKRDILVVFLVCAAFLVFQKFKDRQLQMKGPLKILSLSLFPIVPWLVIGKYFNWRNAWVSLSNFASFDKITAYFFLIPAQLSWIIFFLFVLSLVFALIDKKNLLFQYWGFFFIVFYCFYTSQGLPVAVDRFAMAFYPTIAVFVALLLSGIVNRIKWKHTFKLVFVILTIYLIALCTIPSLSAKVGTYKNIKAQYFPNKKAMQWVRDNVKDGERILSLRFKPDKFYRDKYEIDRDKIISFWYEVMNVFSTPEKLKAYCNENKVTYIMFPYGPSFLKGLSKRPILEYLKENRNDEFNEAAKFNLDENFIYIYKIKNKIQEKLY